MKSKKFDSLRSVLKIVSDKTKTVGPSWYGASRLKGWQEGWKEACNEIYEQVKKLFPEKEDWE